MATFTGDFDVTQNSEDTITLRDTSTGSDDTITDRTITVTDYTTAVYYTATWAIADSSITIPNFLTQDQALNINVTWNTPTPDPDNLYTVTKLVEFDYFNLIFLGQLIAQFMARTPNIVNDTDFMNKFFQFYSYIVSARVSIGLMNDIMKGQLSLDLATYMRNNQTKFFS